MEEKEEWRERKALKALETVIETGEGGRKERTLEKRRYKKKKYYCSSPVVAVLFHLGTHFAVFWTF